MEVAEEFVDVVGSVARLREHGIDEKSTKTTLQDQVIFRPKRAGMIGAERDAVIYHRSFLLVPEK